MKKQDPKRLRAQAFLNIEDISGGLIYTTDKYLIGFLSLAGNDNSLLQDNEHQRLTEQMSAALSGETDPWQILSIPRTADTQSMLERLAAMGRDCADSARLRLLEGESSALRQMVANKEPMVLLKVWAKAALGADKELLRRMEQLASRLRDSQISAYILEDRQIRYLCKLYSDLNLYHALEEPEEDVTILEGTPRRWRESSEESKAALLDSLTPLGAFSSSKPRCGSGPWRAAATR